MKLGIFQILLFVVFAVPAQGSLGKTSAQAHAHSKSTTSKRMVCVSCKPPPGNGGARGGSKDTKIKVSYFSINPQNRTVVVRSSNGVSITFNDADSKVYVSAPSGSRYVSMHDVLMKWAKGDIEKAASMRARIHDMVLHQDNTSMLVSDQAGNDQIDAVAGRQSMKIDMSTNAMMAMPGGHYLSCSMGFNCMIRNLYDFGYGWGAYTIGFWEKNDPGNIYSHNTNDYRYWQRWREAHCNSIANDKLAFIGSGAAFVGSCLSAETGLGAVACAGTYVTTVASGRQMSKDEKICHSIYPGKGGW